MQDKVRWGILGCGRIARHAIAPACGWSQNGVLHALASRDETAAQKHARELGAARAHGSYEALLEDPEVDAVYIGLPNGLHATWAARAAEAGKHVLCDKSLALDRASAERVAGAFASRKLRLVEGYMYRHHPQWRVVRDHLESIGPIRHVRASLSGLLSDGDHRWSETLGGGALFDVACYGVDVARWMIGSEPSAVSAFADMRGAVSASVEAALVFEGGALASASGSLVAEPDQSTVIVGARGRIEVVRPFIPAWDPTEVIVTRGGEAKTFRVAGANHFLHQVEHFAALVLDPSRAPDPAEDGLANAIVLDAVARSLRERSVVPVERSAKES